MFSDRTAIRQNVTCPAPSLVRFRWRVGVAAQIVSGKALQRREEAFKDRRRRRSYVRSSPPPDRPKTRVYMRCDRVGDDKTTFDKIWHVPFRRPRRMDRWLDGLFVLSSFCHRKREREREIGRREKEDTPKCVHCKVLFLTNGLRIVKCMSCYKKTNDTP